MTCLRPGRGVKIVDTLARGNNWFNIQGNGRKPPIDYDRDMVEEVIGRRHSSSSKRSQFDKYRKVGSVRCFLCSYNTIHTFRLECIGIC